MSAEQFEEKIQRLEAEVKKYKSWFENAHGLCCDFREWAIRADRRARLLEHSIDQCTGQT